jgi:hypothetical protein
LGERADRFAQHVDVTAETEIEAGKAVENHDALLRQLNRPCAVGRRR